MGDLRCLIKKKNPRKKTISNFIKCWFANKKNDNNKIEEMEGKFSKKFEKPH